MCIFAVALFLKLRPFFFLHTSDPLIILRKRSIGITEKKRSIGRKLISLRGALTLIL